MKSLADTSISVARSTISRVIANNDILFTIIGDILITSLVSECYSANNATASTLQYTFVTNEAQTQTLSGVSASLANAIKGTIAILPGNSLTAAPVITPSGVALNTTARGIRVPSGLLKAVIGVGPTTGTWTHYLTYEPLEQGAYVMAT